MSEPRLEPRPATVNRGHHAPRHRRARELRGTEQLEHRRMMAADASGLPLVPLEIEPYASGAADQVAVEPSRIGFRIANPAPSAAQAAAVTEILPPPPGAYRAGQKLPFTVSFSEPVRVIGRPRLNVLLDGQVKRAATYVSGSGSSTLTFEYVVGRKENAGTITLGSTFGFSGRAAIRAAGRRLADAIPAGFAGLAVPDLTIDNRAPSTVGRPTMPPAGVLVVGQALEIVVPYSEPVFVDGSPRIAIKGFDTLRQATYASGSGSRDLTFRYVVQPGDRLERPAGPEIGRAIVLAAGSTIRDRAGNRASLRLAAPAMGDLTVAAPLSPRELIERSRQTDPSVMGWMIGSPPPADKLIRFEDLSFYLFPQLRWTFSNSLQFGPRTVVSRGTAGPSDLPRAERADLDAVEFVPLGTNETLTWREAFDANFTDGIVVLHRGTIVYERYGGVFSQEKPHVAQSVTKSLVGLAGQMLVAEGRIDENALVRQYVPELANSAFGDATVRQVLDMRTGLTYSEDLFTGDENLLTHGLAGGLVPRPEDYAGPKSFYEFLNILTKRGEHGGEFAYKTVNSDVMGWVIRRVTGQSIGEFLSDRIWKKIGMEQDAYFHVDSEGTEFAGGGLSTSLRDLARLGELLRNHGVFNGEQIIPVEVIDDIRFGGDPSAFPSRVYPTLPGWSYRNMWWVSNDDHGVYMARGIHGQNIYVDPAAEMVIVRFASHEESGNVMNDPCTLPAYRAVAEHLMAQA